MFLSKATAQEFAEGMEAKLKEMDNFEEDLQAGKLDRAGRYLMEAYRLLEEVGFKDAAEAVLAVSEDLEGEQENEGVVSGELLKQLFHS